LHSEHFLDESLSGLIPELSFGNLLSSPSTPVIAYPLAGIRNYRWQVAEQSAEEVACLPVDTAWANGCAAAREAVQAIS
jgi:hypothetical protein